MPTVTCENCAADFHITPNRLGTARACSRVCLGALQSRERKGVFGLGANNPMWDGGKSPIYYRRFLKDACERCGSTRFLLIHHRDRNRANGEPTNFETLCASCHQIEHNCVANLPPPGTPSPFRTPEQACSWCGAMFHRPAHRIGKGFCSRRCAMLKRNANAEHVDA